MTFSEPRSHAPPLYKLQVKDNVYTKKCTFMYDYVNNRLPVAFSGPFLTYKLGGGGRGSNAQSSSGITTWSSLDNRDKLLPRKSLIRRIALTPIPNMKFLLLSYIYIP